MSDDQDDKQHEATAKKLEDLRESGQTLRSKDLSSGLILVGTIIVMVFMADSAYVRFENNFITAFTSIRTVNTDDHNLMKILSTLMTENVLFLTPIFMIAVIASFSSVFIVGGWNFSLKAIEFKLDKINPFKNLSNIYSKKMLYDVVKSFLKFSIIVGLFYIFIKSNFSEIRSLSYLPLRVAIQSLGSLVERFMIMLFLGIVTIILMDVATSFMNFQSKTKMSNQEVKDEQKNTEGNADVKRKLRSLQYSLMRQKIPQLVPQATVLITNPTHYAVALQYKDGTDKAPKVLAKGKGSVAQYMRKLAIASGVPIYEEPPLARAIFHTTKTGGLINPGLYMAVAIVLAYINQLRRYQAGQGALPAKADSIEIPPNFNFKE